MILDLGTPNAKQEQFLCSTAKYIGYGGARGGGKSWAIRAKAVLLGIRHKGLNMLLLRRTYPELNENHILPLMTMLDGIAEYKEKNKVFEFSNGSRLKVGYCNGDKDVLQYQGQEYDVILIDECTQFYWSWVQFILTSLRTTRKDGFRTRAYFTGNPGGVGHNWFKRLFVKGLFEDPEVPEDYEFIPATVDDNLVLMEADPNYVLLLESLPEKLKQAHRFGNWDIFEGQFFEEFRDVPENYDTRVNTHVINPFEIPPTWTIYRSFDYGYAKPFSVAWWAVDYDGRLYRILEMYGCTKTPNEGVKWTSDRIFSEVAEAEKSHRWLKDKDIIGVADPAIWTRESSGISIADTASSHKVFFNRADNTRIAGWQQVHTRLKFDENGIPMLYAFNTCKGFIRTMPLQVYDGVKPEDLWTEGEDHIPDEVRYVCMLMPITPRIIKKKDSRIKQDDPLDMVLDKTRY